MAELEILKGLKFTTNSGGIGQWDKGFTFTPNRQIGLSQNPSLTEDQYAANNPKEQLNTLEQTRSDRFDWNWDNYLTYKKQFGKHDLTVIAGTSRSTQGNVESLNATRYDVPEQSNYWFLDLSENNKSQLPATIIGNSHGTPIISIAYFARLEYAFNSKYLLSASIRREGISVFQSAKKWGNFPSVSLGWVVNKENFMKNVKFINQFKLRAGYGEVGNGGGATYNYTSFSGNNYPFGGVSQPGTYVNFLPDYNLTWETIAENDFGADFILANNHLSGTVDFYNRKTVDVKLDVQLPEVYSKGLTLSNTGVITNKGIEVTLRWDDTIGENIKYWIGGNFSQNKNELSEIKSEFFKTTRGADLGNGNYTKLVKLGDPIGSFYVFQQTGYNSDGAPVYNDMIDGKPGLTDDDRINAGSYIPKYTYGINLGITYKNIDLSADAYAGKR